MFRKIFKLVYYLSPVIEFSIESSRRGEEIFQEVLTFNGIEDSPFDYRYFQIMNGQESTEERETNKIIKRGIQQIVEDYLLRDTTIESLRNPKASSLVSASIFLGSTLPLDKIVAAYEALDTFPQGIAGMVQGGTINGLTRKLTEMERQGFIVKTKSFYYLHQNIDQYLR